MKRALVLLLVLASAAAAKRFDPKFPPLGTRFGTLPSGPGRAQTEAACFACHSADILMQQRLTEKQWTATVEKMMRWGASVPETDKQAIVNYLSKHFGPANKYVPRKTRPARY